MPGREYRDPIDGALLIGYRSFASMADAEAWVRAASEAA